jgi:hypothetical protein
MKAGIVIHSKTDFVCGFGKIISSELSAQVHKAEIIRIEPAGKSHPDSKYTKVKDGLFRNIARLLKQEAKSAASYFGKAA